MTNTDYPHLIREDYYLNEQAQQKLNENNHTPMKTHYEQKLKSLRDNLLLMQELRSDPLTDDAMKQELRVRIGTRLVEIEDLKKTMKLIPVTSPFFSGVCFELIGKIEGTYPNTANI